jgi:CRISPR/Cas system CSM-associated protein Csm3 (group 7 of RAMP superfamily)
VKIDKFTSGAMEGALFSEKVVENKGLEFKTTILVKNSKEEDYAKALSYLEKALDDIDRGTLTLGGGSGRGHGAFKCKWTKTEME